MTRVIEKSWQSEAVHLAELKPMKLLFICVQNSARSQLAEAIARHLAPSGVAAISAGSQPTMVRPQVYVVLEEVGISSEGLHSKSVNDIDPSGIDAVITLCADGVCPIFLSLAPHLHWALPDPVAIEGEAERLEAFRQVRDELIRRLNYLFRYELD